jgi:hypothetical protein
VSKVSKNSISVGSKSSADVRPGPDRPYYETDAGVVFAPAYMSNGITGAPPSPGMRGGPGDPGSGQLDGKNPRTSNNGVPGNLFGKGEGDR